MLTGSESNRRLVDKVLRGIYVVTDFGEEGHENADRSIVLCYPQFQVDHLLFNAKPGLKLTLAVQLFVCKNILEPGISEEQNLLLLLVCDDEWLDHIDDDLDLTQSDHISKHF